MPMPERHERQAGRERIMHFSIGDKVVHPRYGPGRIAGAERREFLAGRKLYYKIEIPTHELSVYLPRDKMAEIGVRPAMSHARLPRVLARLGSRPCGLSEDYRERQQAVCERLNTGLDMQVAEVVRDLAWRQRIDHLTKRDAELLAEGKSRLAAEMALVSGVELSEMTKRIEETLAIAMSSLAE
jgi:CarD family transcriptional regulator